MNRQAYIYVGAVTASAVALFVVLPTTDLISLGSAQSFGLATFVAVAILSEALAIDFAVGPDRTAKSSVAFLPLLASAVIFPPIAAAAAAAVVEAFSELFLKRRVLWRAAFNISQSALAIGFASLVYNSFGRVESGTLGTVLAFGALAVTSFGVNFGLVSGFFAVRNRQPFLKTLGYVVGSGGVNLFYGLLASPVALAAALLYDRFYIGGLFMILLPIMLIRYSYLSKVQLTQANQDLLRVLIKAIETRDPYTSGHSVRVSTLARAIADDLNVGRRNAEKIEKAALLHDIGKMDMIYVPIIRKPSDLTEEERAVIRSHATKGAELLRTLSSLDDEIIRGVRHHHERWDGTGYPDGLKGKEIPLAARIIMLCDSIDAMLSDRPYRRALSLDVVKAELVRCSGTQFDPEVVDVILRNNTLERALEIIEKSGARNGAMPEYQAAQPVGS